MLSTALQAVDKIIINAATSTSVAISVVGVGMIDIPVSLAIACGMTLSIEDLYELLE